MPENIENLANIANIANLANLHSQAFGTLGETVAREHIPIEQSVPVKLPPTEMERIAHPGFNQAEQVSGGLRALMEEMRAALTEIREFSRVMAVEHRQFRLELNDIRGYVERSRDL